jgi:hypothetical protein
MMKSRRTMDILALALLGILAALAVGTVARDAGAKAPRGIGTSTDYPNSLVVIGHSGATGYDSDTDRSRWSHNSWVTGDNPAVKSLYLRILEHNPAIKGNNFNLAINGSKVDSLLLQARRALTRKPDLVVIQSIDNDITCDDIGYKQFGPAFARVLDVLAAGAPEARIFVVSQFGSPGTSAKALTLNQRIRAGGGPGRCDFLSASGTVIPKRVAYLETVIHRYEAAVATACKDVATCRYDEGAFGAAVDRPAYISHDLSHFSIQGHAKAAAVAWSALKRVGIIPSNG